jgi:redox-sensitive bicupin YhaK (pirin superfamily)
MSLAKMKYLTNENIPRGNTFMILTVRKSEERGYFDKGWLKTHLTFSFDEYEDSNFTQWGCLRVLNEDKIKPGYGFPTHSHDEFNIFSYIVQGELTHKDSIGNAEIIKEGQIQFTCAGTGIKHSEYNKHKNKDCHLLQIWVSPRKSKLKPTYSVSEVKREDKIENLLEILSSTKKDGVIYMESNMNVYASILKKDQAVTHQIAKKGRCYLHLINKKGYSIQVNDVVLMQGDGLFVTSKNEGSLKIQGLATESEFVLLDIFDNKE